MVGQITSTPILDGEQVLASKLLRPNDAGLAYFVQDGQRAVAVYMDALKAVGGHIRPGNYVDVLGTFDFGRGESADVRTVTLFQNIWVLWLFYGVRRVTGFSLIEENREVIPSKGPLLLFLRHVQ